MDKDASAKSGDILTADWTWTSVPLAALEDGGLSDSAFRVLAALWSHGSPQKHTVFPGVERLAEMTGKSVRQVRRLIHDLEQRGWVTITPASGKVNQYRLYLEKQPTPVTSDTPDTHVTPDTDDRTPLTPVTGTPVTGVTRTKQITIQSNESGSRSEKQREQDATVRGIAWICFACDPENSDEFLRLPDSDQSNIRRYAKQWRDAGYDVEALRAFYPWFRKSYEWHKGRPSLKFFKSKWPEFMRWYERQREYEAWQAQQNKGDPPDLGDTPADPQAAMRDLFATTASPGVNHV